MFAFAMQRQTQIVMLLVPSICDQLELDESFAYPLQINSNFFSAITFEQLLRNLLKNQSFRSKLDLFKNL